MSKTIDLSTIFITDLSLHSIGIILYRLKNFSLFSSFVGDVIVEGVGILSLPPEDLKTLDLTADKFNLDFDDAYQYAVAAKYDTISESKYRMPNFPERNHGGTN